MKKIIHCPMIDNVKKKKEEDHITFMFINKYIKIIKKKEEMPFFFNLYVCVKYK